MLPANPQQRRWHFLWVALFLAAWMMAAPTTAPTTTTVATSSATLPCNPSVSTVQGVTYYQCGQQY